MLADATLPPNNDHTYAQWLERIEVPRSPQPSPFKRRTATPVKKYMPIGKFMITWNHFTLVVIKFESSVLNCKLTNQEITCLLLQLVLNNPLVESQT
jgi:hypothetical protein